MILFRNRRDAGRQLAKRLFPHRDQSPVILALARGGVEIAAEVARTLGAPMDVLVVRKLQVPEYPGLGLGVSAEGGIRIAHPLATAMLGISKATLATVAANERREIARRLDCYRRNRPFIRVKHRTVIIVDDGLASGLTARAAIKLVKRAGAARIVLAVPVCGSEIAAAALGWVDDLVCVACPPGFLFISDWYADFSDPSDERVVALLTAAAKPRRKLSRPVVVKPNPPRVLRRSVVRGVTTMEIAIGSGGETIRGLLEIPDSPRGVVIIAHGAGSNRHSPRNRIVAAVLHRERLATVKIDLLTAAEQQRERKTRHLRFNIGLLTERVLMATESLAGSPAAGGLPLGYYGSSVGAAAMLAAAARARVNVSALVSRGGRPDLVEPLLPVVRIPTLLVAGGRDSSIVDKNRRALALIGSTVKGLAVIKGATHLFKEPGALNKVAKLAGDWFRRYLPAVSTN